MASGIRISSFSGSYHKHLLNKLTKGGGSDYLEECNEASLQGVDEWMIHLGLSKCIMPVPLTPVLSGGLMRPKVLR